MRSVLFFTWCWVAASCARVDDSPRESTLGEGTVAAELPTAPSGRRGQPPTDPSSSAVESHLFPAELVMDHQAALGLDAAQTTALRADVARAQAELVEAEWSLRRAREALAERLSSEHVDEASAMTAADRVIEAENTIKRIHLRLLVRIKNRLTPTQQARLTELRGTR
jgi:hypothetical protein